MKPRITLITLGVDDLNRAVEFYRDSLGLNTQGVVGNEFEHGAVAFRRASNSHGGRGRVLPTTLAYLQASRIHLISSLGTTSHQKAKSTPCWHKPAAPAQLS
jgi:catechol 2,3-dioxygenase-like lactoylglutathione lyase family enzyme